MVLAPKCCATRAAPASLLAGSSAKPAAKVFTLPWRLASATSAAESSPPESSTASPACMLTASSSFSVNCSTHCRAALSCSRSGRGNPVARLAQAAELPERMAPGRQLADAFDQRARPGHVAIREVVAHAPVSGRAAIPGMRTSAEIWEAKCARPRARRGSGFSPKRSRASIRRSLRASQSAKAKAPRRWCSTSLSQCS